MDPDHVDGGTVDHAVRKVLDASGALEARDAAADDGDVGAVESGFEFQMRGDVAEPGFAGRDGPDAAERLVLDINALCGVSRRSKTQHYQFMGVDMCTMITSDNSLHDLPPKFFDG